MPVGAQVVSDPLDFGLRAGTNLTVTIYLADGQASTALTSHPGSRTTSYLPRRRPRPTRTCRAPPRSTTGTS